MGEQLRRESEQTKGEVRRVPREAHVVQGFYPSFSIGCNEFAVGYLCAGDAAASSNSSLVATSLRAPLCA